MKKIILVLMVFMAVSLQAKDEATDWNMVIARAFLNDTDRLNELMSICKLKQEKKYKMFGISETAFRISGVKTMTEYKHRQFLHCLTGEMTKKEQKRCALEMSYLERNSIGKKKPVKTMIKKDKKDKKDKKEDKDYKMHNVIFFLVMFGFYALVMFLYYSIVFTVAKEVLKR